jgi:hypothetical protein
MPIDEFFEFFGKPAHPMMLLLSRDVRSHLANIRFRHREHLITSSPREFLGDHTISVYPMGRTSLDQLNHLFDGLARRKIDKGMNVIGIQVVAFHIDSVDFSVLAGVLGDPGRGFVMQQLFTIQCAPDQMDPAARMECTDMPARVSR